MRRAILAGGLVMSVIWMAGVAAAAEGQRYQTRPQGPRPAVVPLTSTAPASSQAPMTSSALPSAAQTAIPASGTPALGPTPTNLGGEASMGSYTLGPDDVVHIDVGNQPDFTGTYVVGQDGLIQYGLIGDIKVDGLTKDELAEVVTARLTQYVRFPSVSVTITGFNSKAIYILGKVANPGKYAMRGDTIKLRDALVAAGLETQYAALSKVRVIKTNTKRPITTKVDLKSILYEGEMADDIDLMNGDIVVVPTTVWGRVMGFFHAVFSPVFRVAAWAV